MSGISDRLSGAANEGVGKVKQSLGGLVGSEELKAKGAAQELKGGAQTAEGNAKDAATQSSGDRERRIRDRAYELWEQEGRPDGREHAHWREAESAIDAEDAVR
jgi:uncharacterized protein YjbJ (UPF0337 family)